MNTTFRRLAPYLWRDAKDPSTYGEVDVDLTAFEKLKKEKSISLLAVLLKALSEGYRAVPQVNSTISFGRVKTRSYFAISLMVPHQTDDLCFATFHDLQIKEISQIHKELREQLDHIKSQNGVRDYKKLFSVLKIVPRFLLPLLVPLLRFLLKWDLFKVPLVPRRPFGAMIVSNVGTLGFHRVLLPLVPFSGAAVMVSLGLVENRPISVDNKVESRPCVTVGFNLDHRIMDGFHAQKFITAFKDVFTQPDKY
jgi:pyruvate/2-oxoglutarate dehydrogenase complex dihydrolipoamide acyltransferase (E2) component